MWSHCTPRRTGTGSAMPACAPVMLLFAAADSSLPPDRRVPKPKVNLVLDPLEYRSASQGPIMPKELEPTSLRDLDEIDDVIERATRTHGWKPIIPQYSKQPHWAWMQWEGTIVERLWKHAMWNMLVPTVILVMARWRGGSASISWWKLAEDHRLSEPFQAFANGWNYLLTLATFVTTFFVGHSHDFWRKAYALTRSVQGRINDLGMLAAMHAARTPDGSVTEEANELMMSLSRNLRLLHYLFYADVCYRKTVSPTSQSPTSSVRLLLSFDRASRTAPGLERLRERGLVTDREYETLVSLALPPARWYLVVMEWVAARLATGRRRGVLVGGHGLETLLLGKVCDLRAACMSIPDALAARMPMAYVHFTHCLIDILLLLAPFGLYHNLGCFSIPMTGVISLFYRGLLELSKSFLDPFGNRRVSYSGLSSDISIDCLVGETNVGSLVWPQGTQKLPFD